MAPRRAPALTATAALLALGCSGGGGDPPPDPDAADATDAAALDDAPPPDAPTALDAPAAAPTFATVFSRRDAANGRDTAIEDALVRLIDATPAGAEIRVALYTFTRSPPSAALVRAAARGVDVAIVLDGGADGVGSEVPALIAGLGAAAVHLCDAPGSACVGSGIMHHKTFLFSALTDGRRDVVAQASHNLTTTQLTMHNNAVIVAGDATLYAAYRRTWDDLFADVEIPAYDRRADGDGPTHVHSSRAPPAIR
jgi:phosphatidylserine/phosphatidylglycerophosphate/cardiolipin synthase-like enzyme